MKKRHFGWLIAFIGIAITFITSTMVVASAEEFPFVITENATYYETSEGFGSGRSAVVQSENPYVDIPCLARVNGYSYLDERGNILAADFREEEVSIEIPSAPEGAVKLMKHFSTARTRSGWVDGDGVSLKATPEPEKPTVTATPKPTTEPIEKQDSKELAEMIASYDDGTTVVLIDRSSSMDKFADEATKEFRKLSVDKKKTKIYLFGRYFKEVSASKIIDRNADVRKDEHNKDYLAPVLNDASKYYPSHLIILSDFFVYYQEITPQKQVQSVDILVPPEYLSMYDYSDVKKWMREAFPNAKVSTREFKNR